MIRLTSILSLSVLPVLLLACANPSPLAQGYSRDHKEFRSKPGPEAGHLGYKYSANKNDEILTAWERIAGDMVLVLEQQLQGLPQDIVFNPHANTSAAHQTFDHALRQELIVKGYNLNVSSPTAENTELPVFSFDINRYEPESDSSRVITPEYSVQTGYKRLYLSLHLTDLDGSITEIGDVYDAPAYSLKPLSVTRHLVKTPYPQHYDESRRRTGRTARQHR